MFVEPSDEEGMEYLVQQEKDRASESQVCLFIKVKCILRQLLGIDNWCSALLLPVSSECLSNISCGIPLCLPTELVFPLGLVL